MKIRSFLLFVIILYICRTFYGGEISNYYPFDEKIRRIENVEKGVKELETLTLENLMDIIENKNVKKYVKELKYVYDIKGCESQWLFIYLGAIELIAQRATKDFIPRLKNVMNNLDQEHKKTASIPDPIGAEIIQLSKAILFIDTRDLTIEQKIRYWIEKEIELEKRWKIEKIPINHIDLGAKYLIEETRYDEEGIKVLIKLYNQYPEAKGIILNALAFNPNRNALQFFIDLINDKTVSDYKKNISIWAIQKIGDKSAIPFLKEIANDKNEHKDVREAAEKAIEVLSK